MAPPKPIDSMIEFAAMSPVHTSASHRLGMNKT